MMNAPASILRLPAEVRRTFFGAIFQREVNALGRRRTPYWVRCVYTLLLIAIVSLVFLSVWDSGSNFGYGRQNILEVIAPAMLITIGVFQMVALPLIAPVLTAGAIADEKRQRTLPTLLTTPLKSRHIILGKLGARTIQLLVLALVPLPLLLALRVFGGVEAEAILASMLLSMAMGMLGASLALMFSIWHRRTPSVVFFALCSTAVLAFLPWLAMMISQWSVIPNTDNIFFKCIAPIALFAVLYPEELSGASIADVRDFWIAATTYLAAASAGIVLFSILVLRGVLKREATGTASTNVLSRLVAPGVETTTTRSDGTLRDARNVGDRPVLWRELRQNAIGGAKRTLFAVGLGIAILLIIYATIGMERTGTTTILLFITALGLTAQAALSTPASITTERDAGNWSVLLTTPVKPIQVVLGKTLGSIRKLWLLPGIVGFHLVLVMASGWFHPIGVLHAAILIAAIVFMLASTGVCLGLMCKRGVTASVLNMAIPLAMFLGFPILMAMYDSFYAYNYYSHNSDIIATIVMVSNPFILLAEAGMTATGEVERFNYYLRYETLEGDNIRLTTFTGMVLLCAAGMATIAAAALTIATLGFNKWNGRPS